jgi:hypothetical protein
MAEIALTRYRSWTRSNAGGTSARTPRNNVKAAALILHFLACVGEARIERVVRFMDTKPLSFAPGTTRNTVAQLVRQGKLRRVGYGRYSAG